MRSANVSKYWLSPIHERIGLLSARLTEQDFPAHVHDSLVIAVTESGGAKVRGRGDSFMVAPGTVLVFNPGESHAASKGGRTHWNFRSFYVRGEALRQLSDGLETRGGLYFMENGLADPSLSQSLIELHLLLEEGTDRFAIEEKFAQSVGLLYARHGEARPRSISAGRNEAIISKVVALLEARFGENLHLSELANEVGLTQFQLIGLFKSALGITPYSLLTQIRLNHACQLLASGMDICEVALTAGFYDQSALTKHFKKRYAVTPAQFGHAYMN